MQSLASICPVLRNEPMKNHTSFKIGGTADMVVLPETAAQLRAVLQTCKTAGLRYTVMGNGSNLLVSDDGYRGVIIKLCKNFSTVTVESNYIHAQAGALLSACAATAAAHSLQGMAFASGIPGTVGGAVLMNAGAYGGEMALIVAETAYLDKNLVPCTTKDHDFSYRHSIFQENGAIITDVTLKLLPGDRTEILRSMEELSQKRREKQPLTLPSAGSAFKRPPGEFAAGLIDRAGLRGYAIGGAQVSEKHAGFIVNTGGATAADVQALMAHITKTVSEQFGIELQPEIRFLQ